MTRTKTNLIRSLTIPQIAILAIMACCACVVIGLFGGLILNNTTSSPVSPILLSTNTYTIPAPPALTSAPQSPTVSAIQPTDTAAPQPSTIPSTSLRVYFFDVGQGDSILVLSPDGSTVLIDGGEPNTGILSYLQGLGVKHIDLMVATHPHSDHIGGLVQVLNAMPVSRVVTNGQLSTTTTFEHFLDAIASAKVPFVVAKRGDILIVGNLDFSVLSPVTPKGNDLNNNSLVLRLVYGETSFLFMGDADKDAEAGILATGLPVQASILKVGHHGSNTASSPAFLAQVKPAVAIYMAGLGNPYGHPHPETLAALAAVGAQIYGTDVNGTIIVSTDGHTYQVYAQKNGPRAPPSAVPLIVTPGVLPYPTVNPGNLFLSIVSVSSPIPRGATATLAAKTSPGAYCTITVYFKSGPSKAAGLVPKTADSTGNVSWSWKIGTTTTAGTWQIVVTATQNGQTVTTTIYFTVTG